MPENSSSATSFFDRAFIQPILREPTRAPRAPRSVFENFSWPVGPGRGRTSSFTFSGMEWFVRLDLKTEAMSRGGIYRPHRSPISGLVPPEGFARLAQQPIEILIAA